MRIASAVARRIRRNTLGPLPDDPALKPLRSPLQIDLSGRVALVTGAAGEIGRPIARTLAACGAKVAIHYLTARDVAERLCDELNELEPQRACTISGDVARLEDVEAMRPIVESRLGPVDIVVNNAVTWFDEGPVIDQTADQFDRVFRSSVLQAWATARVFSGPMIERRWGRLISLGTEMTSLALPNRAPYTAAKCAMDGMLRSLAKELGEHGITVNQVAPGWVISDKDRRDRDEVQPLYERSVPLGRRGYDQDVANMIAFLASDLAGFVTGVRVPVCGGIVMPEA
ncbi:3-ketoacyl-ACP reductase [Bradyrhizobium sp. SSBR45G]|uniref:SDR family NAD(P)-dependent oxidoreductase n=1 Tax=unclassified Bradyrhizobium TaxID=2631580 RepID=UPI002342A1D8|nr:MULTISPECIES: SDR family oxidoreductase [unclassified Bradyrhizobium]GLH79955.1 3-ketoacyl-ACP reductase [Bradyrhizobium sp. SSBR45G]GLH87331.1 3-ketoacyl-ACP reductase [Bradyrhizobium sp. SSBR45R]